MLKLVQKRYKSINTKAEWLNRQSNDKFVGLRHRDNYRCRSSYKLLEILKKFPQLGKNTANSDYFGLDLGGSPGGWAQVLVQQKQGRVICVDKRYIEPLDGLVILKGDISDVEVLDELVKHKFQLVTSDMAHNFTGNRSVDVPKMLELVMKAFEVAERVLVPDGGFVSKFLECQDKQEYKEFLESKFKSCSVYKPKSTRMESSELFFVCHGFKG